MVFPSMMRKSRSAWLESRVVWDISLNPKPHCSYHLFSCSWSGHGSENQKLLLKLVHWEWTQHLFNIVPTQPLGSDFLSP